MIHTQSLYSKDKSLCIWKGKSACELGCSRMGVTQDSVIAASLIPRHAAALGHCQLENSPACINFGSNQYHFLGMSTFRTWPIPVTVIGKGSPLSYSCLLVIMSAEEQKHQNKLEVTASSHCCCLCCCSFAAFALLLLLLPVLTPKWVGPASAPAAAACWLPPLKLYRLCVVEALAMALQFRFAFLGAGWLAPEIGCGR